MVDVVEEVYTIHCIVEAKLAVCGCAFNISSSLLCINYVRLGLLEEMFGLVLSEG